MRFITISILLAISSPAFATTYFVASSGSNQNTGLSETASFATIQFAADQVTAGDSVIVLGGTYNGFDFRGPSGSRIEPIVFLAPNQDVLINSGGPIRNDGINIEGTDYVEVNGFQVDGMVNGGNGIRIVLADHCIVRNCRCDRNDERGIFTGFTDDVLIEYNVCTNAVDEHGIYVSNSSDRPIIRYNTCSGNNNIGIHLNGDLSAGGDGVISDAQIYGNTIYDNNQAAGINMDGCENPLVYNNLIYNNHSGQGIALFQADGAIVTQGAKIFHNTIIVPTDGRWGILLRDGANLNTQIYNNIIINQHVWRGCIATESTTELESDFNVLQDKLSNVGDGSTISLSEWQALGLDGNSLLADPLDQIFAAIGNDNFHLATSSQAIDQGTITSPPIDFDIDNTARPFGSAPDVGAYEYVSGTSEICYMITLDESINMLPVEVSTALVISGQVDSFVIQILDSSGIVVEDLSGETSPIEIPLSQIPNIDFTIKVQNKIELSQGVELQFH